MPVRKNSLSMFKRGLTQDEAPDPFGGDRKILGGTGGSGGTGGGGGQGGGGTGSGGGGRDEGGGGQDGGGDRDIGDRKGSGTDARGLEDERRRSGGAPGLTGSLLAAMSRGGQAQQPPSATSSQTPRLDPEGFPLVGSAEIAEQTAQPRSPMSGLITGEPGVTLSGLDPAQAGAGLTGGGLGLPGGEAGVESEMFRKMLLEILGNRG